MWRLLREGLPQLTSRRYRRIFTACVATLTISVGVLGTTALVRWQAARAVHSDTTVLLNQAVQQLLRALQSRRGTLTLLRDTLDKAPGLTFPEQQALANSAVAHTRHLLGIGLLQPHEPLVWWVRPQAVSSHDRAQLSRSLMQRLTLRATRRGSSAFTVSVPGSSRTLLAMGEPLRAAPNRSSLIVGLFDVEALLADFFELSLQQPYPVQLLEDTRALYQSPQWPSAGQPRATILRQPLQLDAVQWTLQMQPGATRTARTMSRMNLLLLIVSSVAGVALIGLIWMLAMRTWVLQQAVQRRTSALRRTTQRLREMATTDELTGLHNRRFFLERWQWEAQRAKRYDRPLGCLMIDVDHFKRINDILGHPTGDVLLKKISQELKVHLRDSDIVARFGGDEFIVALPETSLEQATAVAEKLRQIRIDGPWSRRRELGPVRLSVGLSHVQGRQSPQHAIQAADQNLYATRQAVRHEAPAAAAPSPGGPAR